MTTDLGNNLDDGDVAVLTNPAEKYVRIVLEDNENIPPTGQFFGINGRHFVLKPGVPAEVPESIINILNDAVQDVPDRDPITQQVVGYRKRLRFPYRVVNTPTG